MKRLEEFEFVNSFHRLPEGLFARQAPEPHPNPYLVAFSAEAAALLDLDPQEAERPELPRYFNGDLELPGAEPIATLYAGHQFGVWVPQLGDGRALLLGEVRNAAGERWEVQVKGSGRTPFSRGGDGRAVLRSTIREYLCSEAMHGLGIPTTRALGIVGSDAPVLREQVESAAVLIRLAPSHVRFGHFEVLYHRNRHQDLRALANYVLERWYPEVQDEADPYLGLFREVSAATARLIAHWQAVGFAHGVMNTDNMSVLGLTIDYGPFGFLDGYRPDHICNHSDHTGRYAFDRQPAIAMWNLGRFAQTLVPMTDVQGLQDLVDDFPRQFTEKYYELMCGKLGLVSTEPADLELVDELLILMAEGETDYTLTWRALAELNNGRGSRPGELREGFADPGRLDRWLSDYAARLGQQGLPGELRRSRMRAVNPKYVLRNHLAQTAIDRAVDRRDFSEIERLCRLLRRPFEDQPAMEAYAAPAPAWARELTVSCSS